MPKFSIVLATRDRPALFKEALDSVLAQDFDSFEIVVVNDGSTEENAAIYREILDRAGSAGNIPVSVHWLVRRPKGHGQSYSLNFGVSHASGEYVGFLDDDDTWTDNTHLSRAARAIDLAPGNGRPVDLYMSNQKAVLLGKDVPGPIWLEALAGNLQASGKAARDDGSVQVSPAELLNCGGFAHLNCLIVRRDLYEKIGGMDEGIRWECDRDVFLRLVDSSDVMLHHPSTISLHNVPDPSKTTNMTTALSMIDKRLLQIRVLEKATLFASNPLIRAHGRQHKTYALHRISDELAQIGDWKLSSHYAAEACAMSPSLKLFGLTIQRFMRSLVSKPFDPAHAAADPR